jgi:hypothetical protein
VDTSLFATAVTPQLFSRSTDPYPIIQQIPGSYLSMLFGFWRGDVIFTFKFIASKYHKGRVRVTWDPSGDIVIDPVSTSVAFTQIIDISETSEVDIRVPYLQATAWLTTNTVKGAEYWSTSTTPTFTHDNLYTNGFLQMRVLTELSAPVTTSTINILTYVRCADNLEFAAPKKLLDDLVMYDIQTTETDVVSLTMGKSTRTDPHSYQVYMGEVMTSLRQLLRRTNYGGALNFPVSTADIWSVAQYKQTLYPLFPGFDPKGIHTAVGFISGVSEPYNFVPNSVFGFTSRMFVGMRGSMIWDYNIDTPTSDYVSTLSVNRHGAVITSADYYSFILSHDNLKSNTSRAFSSISLPSNAGGCITNQITQSGISASIPFYGKHRFVSPATEDRTVGVSNDGSDLLTHTITVITHPSRQAGGNAGYLMQKFFKIGSDFNLFFFLNCPSLIDQGGVPTAI